MQIDLNELNINNQILLDEYIDFKEEVYSNSGIKKLNNIKFVGRIYYNSSDEIVLEGKINGIMILEDAITLEDVELPLNVEINEIFEENIPKTQNTLETLDVLWQNIVLEVPIRITTSLSHKSIKGNGWELKEEKETNQALAGIAQLLDEGKEN